LQAVYKQEICHFFKNSLPFGSADFIPPLAGLRYSRQGGTVANYSCTLDALHIRQTRRLQILGSDYIYRIMSTNNQKGKSCQMDLPELKNDITHKFYGHDMFIFIVAEIATVALRTGIYDIEGLFWFFL